jgi:hypothetical protein
VECPQQPPQADHRRGLQDADAQRAALQPLDGGKVLRGDGRRRERAARVGKEPLPGLGELDPPAGPGQQQAAELRFEGLDRRRQAGLRDPQAPGRVGEAALFRDSDEVLKLTQFDD